MLTHNPNLLYAEEIVNSLAAAGLRAVCLAPGSRSTPLALACDAHPQLQAFLHLDERCASFFALGLAQASGRPVALVCTSGTAAVEFHPAVAEAQMAGVPLILLTADRPPELRHSGANQTIDQVKMYGDHVLWAVDVALPEADPPAVALGNLRTTAARAYAVADGLAKGPVQLNLPFRKPLEPPPPYEPQFATGSTPSIQRGVLQPSAQQMDRLAELLARHERGWIVCGPWAGTPPDGLAPAVAELARSSGYPIFADPLSGLRFGPHVAGAPVIGGYESFLQAAPGFAPPDLILRLGAVPTSKWLNDFLTRTAPARQIHVRSSGVWADDSHRVSDFLQADETAVCRQLAARVRRGPGEWTDAIVATEQRTQARQQAFLAQNWFDAAVIPPLLDALPDGANLFVGNSLPVRHLDQFGGPLAKRLGVFGNRGASGIDGVVSSALGVAAAEPSRPTVLLIGDVSFYHDLNGLLAVGQQNLRNFAVVLLDNDGGSIFRRLPVAQHQSAFQRLFLTPHGLNFAPAVEMYGLAFVQAGDGAGLRAGLAQAIASATPTVIRVPSDGAEDEGLRRALLRGRV